MHLTTIPFGRLLFIIEAVVIILKTVGGTNITDVVNFINRERKIEINVLVNLAKSYETSDNFFEIAKSTETPKLCVRNTSADMDHKITPLFERFNKNSLTIVWLTESNVNVSLQLLDRILWRIHFKDILIIYQQDTGHKVELNHRRLFSIFQNCWSKGFISVLLWSNYQIYSYHPYPSIKVITLKSVAMFMDKSHLNNLQQYTCRMPFFDFPNLCYNYTNRQGKLIRGGYFYKWVQTYLECYNASIDHYFLNMWRRDYKRIEAINYFNKMGYCIMPVFITREPNYFESSDVPYLTRVILLVPNAKEIKAHLYLTLPYNAFMWFIIMVSGGIFLVLMFFMQRNTKVATDFSKLALQAFSVIIFLSRGSSSRKSLKDFYFHLLFLFTGIFLTNYYTSFLSSLYASKVYEPALKYLDDIAGTNLKILEHSYEKEFTMNVSLPKALDGRFIWSGNEELAKYRLALNMSYMFKTHDEVADFLLFQQYYLKHHVAKKLNQELYTRAHYVALSHRSPLIDHFNRYLSRILENGLLMKFIADTKLEGIWSGYLKLMRDSEENKSLTLEYFHYAFVIWTFGLSCAFVSFLIELKIIKRKRNYNS